MSATDPTTAPHPAPLLLRASGVGILLDVGGPGLPRVLHWGADPGALDESDRRTIATALRNGLPHSGLDDPWGVSVLPGQADGWSGTPGLSGHRDGADPFPRFAVAGAPVVTTDGTGAQCAVVRAEAVEAGLAVESELRLEPSGLARLRHTVTNTGEGTYTLDSVVATLPVPDQATELLDLTGRWCRERSPQRRPFFHGTTQRASRRGRTGHDATLVLVSGTAGFGFRSGEVWAVHVAWSGNHLHLAERLPEGTGGAGSGILGGGELLLPGEVRLAPGESYAAPWVSFSYGAAGLDSASARIHRWLRARPTHPSRPRPLVLNTWEAVYFDHDQARLEALARTAALIGVERFVLDDGWFLHRRDDLAGLGDWFVDPAVWPAGLRPLADTVHGLGMEFGLWVEPEMVNPDSDLARAHPDWVLAPREVAAADLTAGADGALPRPWRHQQVLDVGNPAVSAYLLERLDSLVTEIGVDYLKWDHNRDLHEATTGVAGGGRRGAIRDQTLALYRLMDELRARHPGLEIESCSSGGARVDLGILEHTDRVWGSDTNDPVERQAIQRWTGLLVPPELVGSHVGPPRAHTTGRASDLGFRTLTALFGHAGIEWDIGECTEAELAALTAWTGLYRELRPLIHSGDVVRADHPDPGAWLSGVVAEDRREAAFWYVRLATSADEVPSRLRLPGLDPAIRYEVTRRDEAGHAHLVGGAPPWWDAGRVELTGAVLGRLGLPAPLLGPGQGALLHLRAR